MANAHDAHDSHGGGHGADHVPHVTPITHYFGVFGALLVLTAITVGVSYLDFGPWNLVIAMVVATMKATAVAAIFMHLLYDIKFHALVFSFSLIFLAIFITFTSFDTFARGRADLIEGLRPQSSENPFAKDGRTRPMMAPRVPHYGAAPAHGAAPHGAAPVAPAAAPAEHK
jgi:cytochrome c oxidase subunit 4